MKKKVITDVIPIDKPAALATIFYGFTSIRAAMKEEEQMTGEKADRDFFRKVKVLKMKRPGDDEYTYFWGDTCTCCGRKNNGVTSIIAEY